MTIPIGMRIEAHLVTVTQSISPTRWLILSSFSFTEDGEKRKKDIVRERQTEKLLSKLTQDVTGFPLERTIVLMLKPRSFCTWRSTHGKITLCFPCYTPLFSAVHMMRAVAAVATITSGFPVRFVHEPSTPLLTVSLLQSFTRLPPPPPPPPPSSLSLIFFLAHYLSRGRYRSLYRQHVLRSRSDQATCKRTQPLMQARFC